MCSMLTYFVNMEHMRNANEWIPLKLIKPYCKCFKSMVLHVITCSPKIANLHLLLKVGLECTLFMWLTIYLQGLFIAKNCCCFAHGTIHSKMRNISIHVIHLFLEINNMFTMIWNRTNNWRHRQRRILHQNLRFVQSTTIDRFRLRDYLLFW